MRSHVKMVRTDSRTGGDFAIALSLLDETNWCPSMECQEDDFFCPLPTEIHAGECAGDYCSANLPLSDFSGQELANSRFAGSELSCSDFRRAKLHSADFSCSDLCQANLTYADLRDVNFE